MSSKSVPKYVKTEVQPVKGVIEEGEKNNSANALTPQCARACVSVCAQMCECNCV